MHWDFGSLITAIVTPFHRDSSVNYEKMAELADLLVQKGSDSFVVTGTTGESPVLSTEEKLNLYKTVVDAVKGRAKVIAGTGGNSTEETIELSKKAEKTGVDGIMLVVPYYNKPPQEGLYQHFKRVAEEVSLPVMLYNIPGRTAVNLSAETTIRLSEIDNIVAIKEASGDLEQITYICANAPEGFKVYSGDDSMTLPILSVGGDGVVSIASHLVAPQIKEMINLFKEGKPEEAARIHQKNISLFKALFMTTNPIPLKAALKLVGIDVGDPRLPLTPLPEEMCDKLKKLLKDFGLIKV